MTKRKNYAAMLTALDEDVGRLVQSLKDEKMWENALLVFTSDNGAPTNNGGSNAPYYGRKMEVKEGGVKVDGFISGGDEALQSIGIKKGTLSRSLFHIVDWLPTLASLVGASTNATKNLDGVNQMSMLRGQEKSLLRKEVFDGYTHAKSQSDSEKHDKRASACQKSI